ncbi:hypothetical protein [Shewanella youngdeokensis]|uniref:Zinc resistance-associated protein n=1 Tax=Shewanella youngdeokensis TaxID=2999068 RepID=A0ABZ0JZN4_9GAMM|nr:hypothetical protein RGE70_02060 [Shewanella sp. DAU334]
MPRISIVITLLLGLSSMNVLAEGRPDPAQMLAKLTQELSLTDEQQTETAALMEQFHSEAEQLRESGGDRREQRDQMKAIAEERDSNMEQILDADQYEQYQEMMSQMQAQMKNRRGPRN